MKLPDDCKKVLDTIISITPNNNGIYYTVSYVANQHHSSDLSYNQFSGVLKTLESVDAIWWGDKEHTAFGLTEIGRSYKQIDRLECADRWKERIFGFLSGVLVAVIGGIILSWLS